MKAPDKCPKCGAPQLVKGNGRFAGKFMCGSVADSNGEVSRHWHEKECLIRQRDALAERVKQLEEALDSLVQYIYRRS